MVEKVEKTENNKKIIWIQNLRAIACMLIILLHVVDGWIISNNYILLQYSARWWLDCVIIQIITRIGVPCFIMISGALLLNPEKEINLDKILKYIIRMLIILATFGLFFCFCEEIGTNKIYNIPKQLGIIVLNLFQAKSGNVMWYIYMIIGLYIITPVLRSFVKNEDCKTIFFVLCSLFLTSSVVPTINYIFNISITSFYLDKFIYIFYYLSGYYIYQNCNKENKKQFITIGFIGLTGYVLLLIFKNYYYNRVLLNFNINSFVLMMSITFFYIFKECKVTNINNKILNYISKYSFGIYLIHTFWLNFFNKLLKVFPDVLPLGIGEIVFFMSSLILSLFSCVIVYRIPVFKKILN